MWSGKFHSFHIQCCTFLGISIGTNAFSDICLREHEFTLNYHKQETPQNSRATNKIRIYKQALDAFIIKTFWPLMGGEIYEGRLTACSLDTQYVQSPRKFRLSIVPRLGIVFRVGGCSGHECSGYPHQKNMRTGCGQLSVSSCTSINTAEKGSTTYFIYTLPWTDGNLWNILTGSALNLSLYHIFFYIHAQTHNFPDHCFS